MTIEEGALLDTNGASSQEKEIEQLKKEASQRPAEIAPLVRRFLAVVVDILAVSLLLGAIYTLAGYSFAEFESSFGTYERLVTLVIIVLYLGWFNSYKSSGQTLGKRVMVIEVVDENGRYLSLGRSFARSFIWVVLFLTDIWNPLALQYDHTFTLAFFLLGTLILAGSFVTLYSLIFNRGTRQVAHDLLVRSYVILAREQEALTDMPQWSTVHKWVTAGIVLATLIARFIAFYYVPPV